MRSYGFLIAVLFWVAVLIGICSAAMPYDEPMPTLIDQGKANTTKNAYASVVQVSFPVVVQGRKAIASGTGTVISPRRKDGKWLILTAKHCTEGKGSKVDLKFVGGAEGKGIVLSDADDSEGDLAWVVTEKDNLKLTASPLAKKAPAVGTRIWHHGWGSRDPKWSYLGTVVKTRDSRPMVWASMWTKEGDSGCAFFTVDGNEVTGALCGSPIKVTPARAVNGVLFPETREVEAGICLGGNCELAWKIRPKEGAEQPAATPVKIKLIDNSCRCGDECKCTAASNCGCLGLVKRPMRTTLSPSPAPVPVPVPVKKSPVSYSPITFAPPAFFSPSPVCRT